MKKVLLLFAMPMAIVSLSHAQERHVTGTVKGSDGSPVLMATIQIKGTTTGTTTDKQGNFSLTVKDAKAVLVVRSVGFLPREVVVGDNTTLNITLPVDTKALQEVVVTALGIRQDKKAIGYAAQDVKGDELVRTAPSNPLSSLSGKVAGASIVTASGTPGAPVRVQLRGATTILGSNQPLFVIDGLPVDNTESNTESDGAGTAGVLQSNRMIDINPDDVENITILKGPAAAALYGSQASNGAVIITTKKGKRNPDGRSFNVSYGITVNFDKVSQLPERQNKYAQGYDELLHPGDPGGPKAYSFGPAIDTLVFDGKPYLWDKNGMLVGRSQNPGGKPAIAYDPYKFFQTGLGTQHNLAISGGTPNLGYRVSASLYNQKGMIPLTDFKKNTISFSTDYKFTDKFSVFTTMNYVNSGGKRAQQGSNLSGIMLGLLRTTPTFDNSNGVTDPTDPSAYILGDNSGDQRSYRGRGIYDNPYWTVNMNPYRDNVQRFFGTVGGVYKPFEWLSITERFGGDYSLDNRKQVYSKGSGGFPDGQYFEDQLSTMVINNDLFATFTKKSGKFDYSFLVGQNVYDYTTKYMHTQGDGLSGNNFQGVTNTGVYNISISNSQQRRVAFYGKANVAFSNYLFLELTGRYEGNSTLPVKNQFFFYPSASLGYVFTEGLNIKSNILSYGKIRAAFSSVGRGLDAYSLLTYYNRTAPGDGWTNGIKFPYNGLVGYSTSSTLGNPNLTAEKTTQFETGAELRFFDNRVTLDYTYYTGKSKDLLNRVNVAPSSGYGNAFLNAASMQNHGHEVTLGVTPVRNKNLEWNLTFNYAQNRNKVLALAEGIDRFDFNGFTGIFVSAIVGKQYGSLYGTGYVKDAQGRLVINDDPNDQTGYGYPIIYDPLQYLGDVNPKWSGSVANSFNYKGIILSFMIETKQGQSMWNGTWGAMTNFGTSANTLERGTSKVFEGVKGHMDGSNNLVSKGEKNDISAPLNADYYSGVGSGFVVNEPFIQDGSWVRLREISVGYRLSGAKIFKKQKPWFNAVTVTAIGRNLWLHTKYTGVDPETSLFGTQEAQGFDYFNNPGSKTYGFSAKFEF